MGLINEKDLWIFIYDVGEASFAEMAREFVDSGKCAPETLRKYKNNLLKEEKIKMRPGQAGGKLEWHYYVPPEKKSAVKSAKARGNVLENPERLTPRQQVKTIKRLKAERNRYERQKRASEKDRELEELRMMPLPWTAVAESVQKIANDLGLKVVLKRQEKVGKKTIDLSPQILDKKGETVKLGNVFWPDPGEIKAENITLKVVPLEKYPDDYVGGPWKLLFLVKTNKEEKVVLGAYKQLLELENSMK